MMANGAMAVLAMVCTWLVYDVTVVGAGRNFPRLGYPQVPGYGGATPGLKGLRPSQIKGPGNNFLWTPNGRPRNTFARPEGWAGAGVRQRTLDDGLPRAGSAGVSKGNRRHRRDFSGYGYSGFLPRAPAWAGGYGMGAPVGDYGQDFGYASDNWRST